MSKQKRITIEDVLQVANQLGFKPTEEQILEVIEMYPSEQKEDPTGTWDLVVEHCLSMLDVEQTVINKKPLKNSERNLMVIQNFILHITHSSEQDDDETKMTFTPADLYKLADDYIEEDHVDGKENPDD